MEEIAIIEINSILKLVNSTRLTEAEIIRLEKDGENPINLCEYYDTTAKLLGWRSVYDSQAGTQLTLMAEIATSDGCDVTLPQVQVPDVDIPVFGGGL